MSYAKNGIRALGLSFLATFGLMAFAAVGAQGQSAGKWLDLVSEAPPLIPAEIHHATFTGAQEGKGSLLVPKLNMAIECEKADVEEGLLELGGVGHLKLKSLGCIVKTSALVTLTACKIGEGGTITTKAKLLARLAGAEHSNVPFVLAEPLEGTTFGVVTVENETGKVCSLFGTYNLKGTLALKVLPGHEKVQLLIPYANQALLGDSGLMLGENPATLDASATAELTGPEGLAGLTWGVTGVKGQSVGTWVDLVSEAPPLIPAEIHHATFTGAQEGKGSLLVPKLNMAIECEKADVEEGLLELGGVGHLKLKSLGCIVKTSALVTLTACKIGEGGTITTKAKLLARLAGAEHSNVPFVLAEPLEGTTFGVVTVENETGKFCSTLGIYNLKGTLALKVLPGHEKVQLLIPYANQALLGDSGLMLNENPATLDASATAELTGPEGLAGLTWGVC